MVPAHNDIHYPNFFIQIFLRYVFIAHVSFSMHVNELIDYHFVKLLQRQNTINFECHLMNLKIITLFTVLAIIYMYFMVLPVQSIQYLWIFFVYGVSFSLLYYLGSPFLGYLAAGILIGPYGLSIICHVHGTKAIAEFGVVFLLFNIWTGGRIHKQILN